MSKLMNMIKRHEGLKLKPYNCSRGALTIGCGRNLDSMGITEDEALYLLTNDVRRVIEELESNFTWFKDLSGARRDAIIDLCFNIGITSLRLFRNANKSMSECDYEEAHLHYLDSRWADEVGARAIEVCDMIRTNEYQF